MNNPNLVQLIRRIADDTVTYMKPSDWYIGKITSVDPLKIKIGRSIVLTKDFFTTTETFCERKIKKGTKVLMIRKWGGQKYVIIDVVR